MKKFTLKQFLLLILLFAVAGGLLCQFGLYIIGGTFGALCTLALVMGPYLTDDLIT